MEERVSGPAERYRSHSWWERTLSGAIALVIGLGLLWLLKLLALPLALLIAGVTIAAALAPVVSWFERWLPRPAVVALLYLALLVLIALLGWLILPQLWSQLQQVIDEIPQFFEQWQQRINNWIPGNPVSLDAVAGYLFQGAGAAGTFLADWSSRLVGLFTAFVIVLFVSAYGLIEAPRARRFFMSLFPPSRRERAGAIVEETLDAMGGFVRGALISAAIIGVLTYVGLLLLGFPHALALAVLAGTMELIPMVGPFITAVVLVLVGLSRSTTLALAALAFALVLQQIESNLLIPNIMRREANVSPLLTLLALIAGERVGGLIGALIAIPLVAGLRVLVLRLLIPAFRRWTGAPSIEERPVDEESASDVDLTE